MVKKQRCIQRKTHAQIKLDGGVPVECAERFTKRGGNSGSPETVTRAGPRKEEGEPGKSKSKAHFERDQDEKSRGENNLRGRG